MEDIIAGIDREVENLKAELLANPPQVYSYQQLGDEVERIARRTGLFTFEAKKDFSKKDFTKEAEEVLVARLIEEGAPKDEAKKAVRQEEYAAELQELALELKLQYEDKGEDRKSQKTEDTRVLINEALLAPVEAFVYNYVVMQHQLSGLLYADPAFFPNNAAFVKRIQGATSSGKTPLVMPKYEGLPEKSGIAVVKDVVIDFKEIFDKSLDLAPDDPVRIMLQKYQSGKPHNMTDAAGVALPEYVDQMVESYSAEAGIDVVQKLMYYAKDSQGVVRFIKFSDLVLTDELCEQFPQFGRIRDALRRDNTTRREEGLPEIGMAVFESGIKLAKPKKLTDFSDLDSDLHIEPSSVFTVENRLWRMPLNPASNPLGTTQIPTQLNYLINANHLNTEEMGTVYGALEVIFDMGRKMFTKDVEINVKGKPSRMTLTKIRKLLIRANQGLEGRGFETSLLEAEDDFGFSVSNSLPLLNGPIHRTLLAKLSRLTVNSRLRGSKLVLAPEFATKGRISFNKGHAQSEYLKMKDKDGYTEVIMPDTMKGDYSEGQILGFRIPSTHLHSFVALKVVGFYPAPKGADANIVIAPTLIQFASGSD